MEKKFWNGIESNSLLQRTIVDESKCVCVCVFVCEREKKN